MPITGFEPIINSYKGSVLPIKTISAFIYFTRLNFMPWNEIESLSCLLQRHALTVKLPRLYFKFNNKKYLKFSFKLDSSLISSIVFWLNFCFNLILP